MPLSTTSHGSAANSAHACGPATTSGERAPATPPPPPCARNAASNAGTASASAIPTYSTPRATACRASSPTLPPPAQIAVTRKRSRLRSITSIAWVPMDPVDPRRTTLCGSWKAEVMRGMLTGHTLATGSTRYGMSPVTTCTTCARRRMQRGPRPTVVGRGAGRAAVSRRPRSPTTNESRRPRPGPGRSSVGTGRPRRAGRRRGARGRTGSPRRERASCARPPASAARPGSTAATRPGASAKTHATGRCSAACRS